MANLQLFPAANAPTTVIANGRTYTCPVGGTPILVPDFDAFVLLANGWLASAVGAAGTTAQRPAANPALGVPPPPTGFSYFDSTVGAKVIWNGKNWINHATGATA
jgi:hypothetical protein